MDQAAIIQLVSVVVVVILAAVWLRSSIVKQHHTELQRLAETRGQLIEDQDAHIDKQDARIKQLEESVAELRGQIQAIQAMKATEIADEVVARLQNRL